MSSDTPPPQNLLQHRVDPNSPVSSAPGSHPMPTPDISSRPGSADPTVAQAPAAENELQSQPMTSTSSSTELTGPDSTNASSNNAPYGTRSRGRNAAPRPNYAEDRDIDMDLEIANTPSKSAKRASGSAMNHGLNGAKNENEKSSNSRKGQPAATNGANQASKDLIPGTSSFSAKMEGGNGPSTSAKKRKQPATAPNSNSANGNAAKKIFTTASGGLAQDQTESNMVTFDVHGAYLKDGKLKADDGSVYSQNGWLTPNSTIISTFVYSV